MKRRDNTHGSEHTTSKRTWQKIGDGSGQLPGKKTLIFFFSKKFLLIHYTNFREQKIPIPGSPATDMSYFKEKSNGRAVFDCLKVESLCAKAAAAACLTRKW
jgi:hypothetical protein